MDNPILNQTMTINDQIAFERAKLRNQLQDDLVAIALRSFAAGEDVLLRAPTGMGKTRTFNRIAVEVVSGSPTADVLVVQDRIKVARQNQKSGLDIGTNTSLSLDGNLDQSGRITYATSATAFANIDKLKPYALVVVDECQHASDDETSRHSAIIGAVTANNPAALVVGASATPRRPDGKSLHPRLQRAAKIEVCYQEAFDCGAIVKPQTITPPFVGGTHSIADIVDSIVDPNDPLKDRTGLQARLREARPENYFEQCASALTVHARHEPTFAFCDTIAEAEQLRKTLEEHGHAAGIVHSRLRAGADERAFSAYEAGRLNVLVSVDMLTEGVDITRTGVILNCKATTTPEEYQQIAGRAMRAHAEISPDGNTLRKDRALIIECGASALINGSIERLMEIESFAIRGASASRWRPWTLVSKEPHVLALHDGERTIFAARTGDHGPFSLFVKEEAALGNRRISGNQVRRFSPRTASAQDLADLGQAAARQKMATFAALDSRIEMQAGKQTTALRALCRRSYAASHGSLSAFMAPAALVRQPANRTRAIEIG